MMTFLLINDIGSIVDAQPDPHNLDFESVTNKWQVLIRDEPFFCAGGPVRTIADIDCSTYSSINYTQITKLVRQVLSEAYINGSLNRITEPIISVRIP